MSIASYGDDYYFYVGANVWVRYGAPGEKFQSPTHFYKTHGIVQSHYNNTKSTQPTSWRHRLQLLNEHLCQFPDMSQFLIKKGIDS